MFKTKRDAEGAIERLKARLVACGDEQEFGANYSITFTAVMNIGSVKIILCLARKWRVHAKHGDVPNTYVKADKEAELDIYVQVLKGMTISEEIKRMLGVTSHRELVLKLQKALCGLKQAGRLCSKLLHRKLVSVGFNQSLTDMCVYYRWRNGVLAVVGVYVDDLLVTGTEAGAVDAFFSEPVCEESWSGKQVPERAYDVRRGRQLSPGPGSNDSGHAERVRYEGCACGSRTNRT